MTSFGVEASIPTYLKERYWWAYLRPSAVRFWDRPWLVNSILFGKYGTLRDAVLDELGVALPGRTLQVSCCYGELTPRLFERVKKGAGELDVIDVAPIQLENAKRKLPHDPSIRLLNMDAASLGLPDASYDRVVLFFLLHEQPQEYREKTMREALRVLKPDGTIIIADYGVSSRLHPLRFLLLPFLGIIEPTARALWARELPDILSREMAGRKWRMKRYFGGLYQVLASSSSSSSLEELSHLAVSIEARLARAYPL